MEGPKAPISAGAREHSQRAVSGSSTLWLVAVIVATFAGLSLWPSQGLAPTTPGHAEAGDPFLQPHPVVVASDRPVCSFLGEQKLVAGIRGKDAGNTAEAADIGYWAFGD